MISLKRARSELPVTKRYVYLDHAATGPLPTPTVEAVLSVTSEKIYGNMFWDDWEKTAEKTRRMIATLLNASSDEIALVPNTSEGLGIVGNGLNYKPGDNIVTSSLEFTSNLFVWQVLSKRHNLEFRSVQAKGESLELEDFQKMIDTKTRLVAISHVQYSNGFKTDLEELCRIAHENGAYVVADAVQSVGAMGVDVRKLDVDFLASSGYKWLLSPMATGFLYVKRSLIEALNQSIVGYRSASRPFDFRFKEFKPASSARRFEHGQLNFPGFAGMLRSIIFLREFGIDKLESRIRNLTGQVIDGVENIPHLRVVSSTDGNHRSGIVKISCRNPNALERKLRSKGIISSVRARGLRISPHFYNSEREIEYLLKTLRHAKS